MKISIDTAADSHEHIKHVIDMLQRIVGVSNAASAPAPAPMSLFDNSAQSNPLADMFGSPTPAAPSDNPLADMFGSLSQNQPTPNAGMFDSPIPQNPIPGPHHDSGNPLETFGAKDKEESTSPPDIEIY